MNVNERLLSFIYESPTAYHTAKNVEDALKNAGYTELRENRSWDIRPGGKYFVKRNGSSVIGLRIPMGTPRGFMMMAAHGDSPSFRIKDNAEVRGENYIRLNVEKYGGMICSSWMDRPLSVAGRVLVREGDEIVMKLVNIDRDLLLIPNLAFHMDRTVNDDKKFDANIDMLPLFSEKNANTDLDDLIAENVGVKKEDILTKEISLYPRMKGLEWGAENEFISSPRLDDLQCAFGCLQGFLTARENESINVLSIFDNEEIGSGTKQGADSEFMADVLARISEALGLDRRMLLANSFMVSADNAHAVHPNHPEFADRNDRPQLNGGLVVKYNARQRYATDGLSGAVFTEVCRLAGVPVQRYTNRADIMGGFTLGNISSSHVSVCTADIGLAQLSMHSSFETAGARDTEYLCRAAEEFYSRSFELNGAAAQIR